MMTLKDLTRRIGQHEASMIRQADLDETLTTAHDAGHPCVVDQDDVAVARALLMVIKRHPLARGTSLAELAEAADASLIGYVEPPREPRV